MNALKAAMHRQQDGRTPTLRDPHPVDLKAACIDAIEAEAIEGGVLSCQRGRRRAREVYSLMRHVAELDHAHGECYTPARDDEGRILPILAVIMPVNGCPEPGRAWDLLNRAHLPLGRSFVRLMDGAWMIDGKSYLAVADLDDIARPLHA